MNSKSTSSTNTNTTNTSTSDELLQRMTTALTTPQSHQWSVSVFLPASISKLPTDKYVSFDVPFTYYNPQTNTLLATFHSLAGGRNTLVPDVYVVNRFFALYVAECTNYKPGIVPSGQDWTILSKLSDMGSMGQFYPQEDGSVYFTYELAQVVGSTIAIRKYHSMEEFKSNSYWEREVHLKQMVHGNHVFCMGTPTITSIQEKKEDGDDGDDGGDGDIVMNLRFHYYNALDGLDHPGKGTVQFPKTGNGVVSNSYPWDGQADKEVLNAIREEGVVGKIGGRASFTVTTTATTTATTTPTSQPTQQQFLLFEGQMASDGEGKTGWLSWRPVLYNLQTKKASVLTFNLPCHLKTFANPQISMIGKKNDSLMISFFVPNGPFEEKVEVMNYCNFDPSKCPTCARDKMVNATSPAKPGSVMMMIPSFQNYLDCKEEDMDDDDDDYSSDATTRTSSVNDDDDDDDDEKNHDNNDNRAFLNDTTATKNGSRKHPFRNGCIQLLDCLKQWMFGFVSHKTTTTKPVKKEKGKK